MSVKNDEMILKLKEQIANRKAESDKLPKNFMAETSCIYVDEAGEKYNLRVMTAEQLIPLMVKLHMYEMAALDLGIYDGDILIVRSFPVDISSGDIVLTELDGESVLRSCYCLDADQIELRAGNTSDKPRVCKKSEFFPKGVVIGLHRCM